MKPALLGACLLAWLSACSSPSPEPTATETPCNDNSGVTYEGFVKDFMASYCTRCHDSALHGADRQGASLYHDFETQLGILNVADHVDEWAAAGPASVNELMPPNGAKPSLDERTKLGLWLACSQENYNRASDAGVGEELADAGPTADAQIYSDAQAVAP